MPDSNSPYTASGAPQVLELLRHQLVSVSEDRRRVMLWSAILAAGSLMLLGRVASIPWFLALVPLVLLALWQAGLLVRQRRCQAAWDSILQKSENGAGPNALSKAGALASSSTELGARDIPDLLGALASPSVLVFHGLLLSAVIAGGATHEMGHEGGTNGKIAKSSAGGGGGCGCGGGASSERAMASAEPPTRPTNTAPPRNLSNPPQRPMSGAPQSGPYPTRPVPQVGPPGASARNSAAGAPPVIPGASPRTATPLPSQNPATPTPAPGVPMPPPALAPGPVSGGPPVPTTQPPNPREASPTQPAAPASVPAPAGSAKPE